MIKMRSYRPILCASVAAISLMAAGAAHAAPEGGAVSQGSATISQNGNKTDIHQSSNKVILDWRSFDIGADEHTEFHQPSASAIALNRINDTKASKIDGKLTANGNIMLINPNGVVFGKGAQVDVGSLTATTANIDNDDFMAGKMDFKHAGNADAYIVNQGKISVKEAGLVNFVAPKVVNDGVIVAKLGKVQLAATDTFTLDMAGDGLIQVAVDATETQKIASNKGVILAEGGYVAITAGKARNIVDSLVENTGVIAAASMTNKGGKVILGGADTGITVNDGAIDVSGRKNGTQGGEAAVLGNHVVLSANSFIDASGTAAAPVSADRTDTATMTADKMVKTEEAFLADVNRGGGSIKIGGDYLGTGDTFRAQTVFVDAQALTLNDATQYGDGGRTIFWSDDTTDFSGLVYARGGVEGGHGGFLETSGKMNLLADGFADLSAGTDLFSKGTYLLDPSNISIYGNVDPRFISTDGSVNLDTHLQLWLDASDASTITQDGSGRVSAWTDKSHNGYVATAPTVGDQPLSTTSASMNNLGVMYFNGGDDHLTLGSNYIFSTNSGLVVGGVMQSTFETGQSQYVMNFGNNGTAHYGLAYNTTTAGLRGPTNYGGNNTQTASHGKTTSQASVVLGEFVFGSSQNVYIDGSISANSTVATAGLAALGATQIDETATAQTNSGPVTIGAQSKSSSQSTRGLDGYIGELYIYNDTLTTDEKAIINQYESAKWNLALNPDSAASNSEAVEAMASNGFSVFAASYLERLSQTANIVLQATNDITIDLMGDTLSLDNNRSISLTATSGNISTASAGKIETFGTGSITFSAGQDILLSHDLDLEAHGTGDITLRADRNIDSSGGGDFTTNGGNIIFNADRNANNTGAAKILNATISTGGGDFVVGGGTNPYTTSTKASQDGVYDIGADIRNSSIVTAAGDISIRGNGQVTGNDNYGVYLYNTSLLTGTTAGSGKIDIYGTGGSAEDYNHGVYITQDSLLRSDYGDIIVNGTGGSNTNATSNDSNGVWLRYNSQIISQGVGNSAASISITGVSGNGNLGNMGVQISDDNTLVSSIDGDITIQGTGQRAAAHGSVIGSGSYGVALNYDADITSTGLVSGDAANISITSSGDTIQLVGDTLTAEAGSITLNTNRLDLTLDSLRSTSGDITIKPNTVTTSISIGTISGTLNIDDTELSKISAGGKLVIGSSSAAEGDVTIDSWNLAGTAYNVEVYGNDITFQDTDATVGVDYAVNMGSGSFLAHALDRTGDTGVLTANALFKRSAAGTATLDLRADQNIIFNTGSGLSSSTGSVNTILNADRDDDHDGRIYLDAATFTTNGGYFVGGGGSGAVGGTNGILGDGDGTGADDVMAWGNSGWRHGVALLNTSSITTGAGSIFLNGHGMDDNASTGNYGVNIATSSSLHTTSGDININADGGDSSTNSYGFRLYMGTVSTQTGTIDITANAGVSGGSTDAAIMLFDSSVIEATGSGSIYLTGTGSVSNGNFHVGSLGINRVGSATMTGNIEINANSFRLQDTDDSILTQGDIIIKPTTDSTTIGLGGDTGVLNLNDAELARISAGGKLVIGSSSAAEGDVTIDSWNLAGTAYNVEVYGNDITFQDTDATVGVDYAVNMGSGSFLAHARDRTGDTGVLTANALFKRSAAGTATLDLRADQNIIFNTGSGLSSSTGSVNTILNADRDDDHDGSIYLDTASFTTNDGYFIAGGGSGVVGGTNGILGDGDGTGADDAMAWGNSSSSGKGITLVNSHIETGISSIILKGHGQDNPALNNQYGIHIKSGSQLVTTSGDFIAVGYGGNGQQTGYGFFIQDSGSKVSSEDGSIHITGTGAGTVKWNDGVVLDQDTTIESTGAADITITGTKGGGASSSDLLTRLDATIGGAQAEGDITLIVDSIDFSSHSTIRTDGDIYIKPRTNTTTIGLGGGTGELNLTDTELEYLSAGGKLVIGDSAAGTGDVAIDSWDLSGKSHDVEIYGGGITFQDTDATVGVDYAVNMGAGDILAYARANGNMAVNAAMSRAVGGTSVLDLRADNNITFGSGGNITASTGDIDLFVEADYDNAGGGTSTFNGSSIDTNGGDIDLNGTATIGADTAWDARGGTIDTEGAITLGANDLTMIADNLTLGGNITGTAGSVLTLRPYDNSRSIGLGGGAGGFNLTDAELAGIGVNQLIIGDSAAGTGDVAIDSWNMSGKSFDAEIYGDDFTIAGMTLGSGDMTIHAGNNVSVTSAIGNSGAGGNIYMNVGNDFTNSAGANGINAGTGGRFLVYADAVSNVTRGGMTNGNLFNRTYAGDDPSTINTSFGSRFVFNQQPTLTVAANNVTLNYNDPAYNTFTYSVLGLVTGDTGASALSGTPSYATTQLNATNYTITPSAGTLTSNLGYLIAFQDGLLVMDASGGTPVLTPDPVTPVSNIPPAVEQQIQPPSLITGGGYGMFSPVPGGGDTAQISYDMTARKTALIRVNTSDMDAFIRMASGGYVIVDNPLAVYYDLCSYNASYCN